ncbi:MAG: hypothetical protein KHY44_14955 [Clostridiales bacterium]|jgi:hypothetical protein|nr:hypothetical protein [Clostridiales bacterium]
MNNSNDNNEQYFHKSRKKRIQYIKKLVRNGDITSTHDLQNKLIEQGFNSSISTLKKDLKHCNIKYDRNTHTFRFILDIEAQVDILQSNLNLTVLEVFRHCKIGADDRYQVFKPIHYGGSKAISLFLHCVMITCPIGYEEILYQTISSHFISFDIFTAQVNKGSVFFLFKNASQKDFENASLFYNALQKYY